MHNSIKKELLKKYDIVIMAAAAADYTPIYQSKTKIKSNKKELTVKLRQIPKILNEIRKMQKDVFLVGFKAETNISKKELEIRSRKKMREANADLIIANDIGKSKYKKDPSYNEVLIVDKDQAKSSGWKKKEKIAKIIRKEIEKRI